MPVAPAVSSERRRRIHSPESRGMISRGKAGTAWKAAIAGVFGLSLTVLAMSEPAKPTRPVSAPHWAYQPVQNVPVPSSNGSKWVRTPIDSFVLAKLQEKHLKPSPDASRETYIRRATLDTWGIVPTPEEVKAFTHDRSSKAYEKLVDRLLASPRYG